MSDVKTRTEAPFGGDTVMEAAAIKSWLLFNHRAIRRNRDDFFMVSVLMVVLGYQNNLETICRNYRERYGDDVTKDRIRQALSTLVDNGILEKGDDGRYLVAGDSLDEVNKSESEEKTEINAIASNILDRAKETTGRGFENEEQLRVNIINCLNYYFRTSCHAIIGIDGSREMSEMPRILEILQDNIKKGERNLEIIIGEIGHELNDEANRDLWNSLARKYLVSQIIGIDPMLSGFKTTVIGSKVFVLDTDTALTLLARNTRQGRAYRDMLGNLKKCGCKTYLPDEVVTEVFHHAEAAVARFPFVANLMESDDETVTEILNNVFVIDYYYLYRGKKSTNLSWCNYIGNYYHKKRGMSFTTDVLRGELGDLVTFGMPEKINVDKENLEILSDAVYDELTKTEKAERRDDELNRYMADTDAKLFLTIQRLNRLSDERHATSRNPSVLLKHDYYILSASSRTSNCARKKGIGFDRNYICNPKALIMILSEIGMVTDSKLNVMDVMDNPFLTRVADVIEDDINNLNRLGVDFAGQNLVKLRYDLHDSIEEMIECQNMGNYAGVVEIAKRKDVNLRPNIQDVVEQRDASYKENEELKREMTEKDEQIEKLMKKLDDKNALLRKEQYERRAFGKKNKGGRRRK